ncbi:MAG: DUF4097 family beta strand repeat-containing protein, partial [Chitinophagaceae bacterium]
MKKYYWIFFLFLVPLGSYGTSVSVVPFTRTVTKTFTVGNGAQLSINNKYGKVILHTWDKNEIQAIITITANGSNSNNSQSLTNQVNIQSDQTGNNVTLSTQYDVVNSASSFWKRFFGGGGNQKDFIHIDYAVYVPQSLANMRVVNNYGDVAGDNIPGDLVLNINYGNFHINRVAGNFQLNANYGNGSLTDISNGTIHANYTDFNLDNIKNMQISSNYSDYKIANAGQIVFNGNYGNFSVGKIDKITCGSNYTDYKINTLQRQAKMEITYGDIRIQTLGNQFSGMKIQSTYGNVKAGIPRNLPIRLDIDLTHGDINTHDLPLQIQE